LEGAASASSPIGRIRPAAGRTDSSRGELSAPNRHEGACPSVGGSASPIEDSPWRKRCYLGGAAAFVVAAVSHRRTFLNGPPCPIAKMVRSRRMCSRKEDRAIGDRAPQCGACPPIGRTRPVTSSHLSNGGRRAVGASLPGHVCTRPSRTEDRAIGASHQRKAFAARTAGCN
jgi:hypothetical protein